MFGLFKRKPVVSEVDRYMCHQLQLIQKELKGLHAMALDVSALNAAVAKVGSDVDALVAAHADPAGQAAVDAAVTALNVVSGKAEAAVAPAPVAPAAAA
jgi:hypothetical protein